MKNVIIKKSEEGKRLDKYMISYLSSATSSFIYKMLRKKNILLNNKKASGKEIIKYGDVISIFFSDETFDKFTKKKKDIYDDIDKISKKDLDKLNIIYEDENMMIIDKPAGILSQKSKKSDISINELCIKHMILNNEIDEESIKSFKPSVVNRIDRDTLGLIIFAKNYKSAKYLSDDIRNRKVDKYYLAIVNGVIKDDKKSLKAYIKKDEKINKVNISNVKKEGYDIIETEYEVLKRGKDITFLKIKLLTGKTHQIRAQFAYLGYPILGDSKYMSKVLYDMNVRKYKIKTQALLSYELVIGGISYKSKLKKCLTNIL